jgi:hypothetical protein
VWQLELVEGEGEGDEFTGVLVSDLVLYLDHEDPGLRGQAAKLVCKVSIFLLLSGTGLHLPFFFPLIAFYAFSFITFASLVCLYYEET